MNTSEFIEQHCVGVRYDECNGTTCQYGSAQGCTHPLFPLDEMQAEEMAKMDAAVTY